MGIINSPSSSSSSYAAAATSLEQELEGRKNIKLEKRLPRKRGRKIMDGFPFNWKSFLAQLFFSLLLSLFPFFFSYSLDGGILFSCSSSAHAQEMGWVFTRLRSSLASSSPASFFLLPLLIPHPLQDQQTIKQTDRHTLTGLEKNDIFLCCTSNGANSSEKNTRPHIIIIIGVKKPYLALLVKCLCILFDLRTDLRKAELCPLNFSLFHVRGLSSMICLRSMKYATL